VLGIGGIKKVIPIGKSVSVFYPQPIMNLPTQETEQIQRSNRLNVDCG
jgi:hypothetical protein